jgi:hypothetical protein
MGKEIYFGCLVLNIRVTQNVLGKKNKPWKINTFQGLFYLFACLPN